MSPLTALPSGSADRVSASLRRYTGHHVSRHEIDANSPLASRAGRLAGMLGFMDITHLGHAAVLVETGAARVLIDPGNFSDQWHGLTDLTAIVVTHQHPDHVDPAHLPALLGANPSASIHVEPSVVGIIEAAGGTASAMPPGTVTAFGDLTVTAVGGQHAVIHRDIPRIGNVGVVLEQRGGPVLFHPGDSLATVPAGVDVLATPAYGPWAAMKETVDFVRDVDAAQGFLIHDGLLSERGWALIFSRMNEMTGTAFADRRGVGSISY